MFCKLIQKMGLREILVRCTEEIWALYENFTYGLCQDVFGKHVLLLRVIWSLPVASKGSGLST